MNMISSTQILAMLDELIELIKIDEGTRQSFKVKAYQKAKKALENSEKDISTMSISQLKTLDGIGESTAKKIIEYQTTGTVDKLEILRKKYPPEFIALTRISGIGVKTAKNLQKELSINSISDLITAIEHKQIQNLAGYGEKSEQKLATTLQKLKYTTGTKKHSIAEALPLAQRLLQAWQVNSNISKIAITGEARRLCEMVDHIDIALQTLPDINIFTDLINHPEIVGTVSENKKLITLTSIQGIAVRIHLCSEGFSSKFLETTGPKSHIEFLEKKYQELNSKPGSKTFLAATKHLSTEKEVYKFLGLPYILPTLREDTEELNLRLPKQLDDLIDIKDIKGDMHYHTDQSGDGRSSLATMIQAAAEKQYDYIAITDHGEDLVINGSTKQEMISHSKKIAKIQSEYPNMKILFGCELNIGPEGNLDYDTDFRNKFEYTVASVHSHFDLSPEAQTLRLVKAISDPTVNSIGHLSARYIGKRPGIEFNEDIVLEALHKFDVALEVNGALQRLDASSKVVKKAIKRGVKLVINTDSHHKSELSRMQYGVKVAQKGWAPKEQVINTWDIDRLLKWISA